MVIHLRYYHRFFMITLAKQIETEPEIMRALVEFAKANHPGFSGVSNEHLETLFSTYKNTTLIEIGDNGIIKGIAVYQEWPDRLNFLAIACMGTRTENLFFMLKVRKCVPEKPICFFDEEKMELKCHQ